MLGVILMMRSVDCLEWCQSPSLPTMQQVCFVTYLGNTLWQSPNSTTSNNINAEYMITKMIIMTNIILIIYLFQPVEEGKAVWL